LFQQRGDLQRVRTASSRTVFPFAAVCHHCGLEFYGHSTAMIERLTQNWGFRRLSANQLQDKRQHY
ncbi:MAG: hypothetical protein ACK5ES_12990, partial [Planctomyces sp.]